MAPVSSMRRTPKTPVDIDAWKVLCALRWGDAGPRCPRCHAAQPYWLARHMKFICAVPWCQFHFTVTTATVFQQHKLPLRKLLLALLLFEQDGPDISTSQFARDLGIHWKSAHVLLRKLRVGWTTNGIPPRVARLVGYWQGRGP